MRKKCVKITKMEGKKLTKKNKHMELVERVHISSETESEADNRKKQISIMSNNTNKQSACNQHNERH